MVDVLEHKDWSRDIECRGCGSKLRIYETDVRIEAKGGGFMAQKVKSAIVDCPVCEEENPIKELDLSRRLRKKLAS